MELIAKIRNEIERLIEESDFDESANLYSLLSFLSTLESEKPVPNDLEEAAENYASDFLADRPDQMIAKASFTAGAEWQKQHDAELVEIAYNDGITIGMTKQKEKMLKEAVEGEICHDRAGVDYLDYDIARLDKYIFSRFKVGDKVRVIIIKEDEKWHL